MRATPWPEIRERYVELVAQQTGVTYMVDIVDSVIASPHRDQLAAITSMWDLVVTATPIPEPPFEVVIVFGPGGHRAAPLDHVAIEHRAHSGRSDRIIRPVAGAVPLFWRFVAEKFGIHSQGPATSTSPQTN